MQESEFLKKCEQDLGTLATKIEKMDKDSNFEVEFDGEVLKVLTIDSNLTYIINKHSASKKIWYSSPKTGADYFSFDDLESKWLNSNGQELSQKLLTELF